MVPRVTPLKDSFNSIKYVIKRKSKTILSLQLTGIIQDMVDDQPNLEEVLKRFVKWLGENNLDHKNTIPVTFGDWDIATA